MSRAKSKIALIIDTDDWAFGNISRQLRKHLSDRFDFIVIPMDIIDNIDQVLMIAKDCEILHFFWREHLRLIGTPYYRSYAESLCVDYSDFEKKFITGKKFSTSIYDHLLLDDNAVVERTSLFSDFLSGYTVSSERLNKIYSNFENYPAPSAVVEDGVDLTLFSPRNLNRFDAIANRDIVVGWVGNSQWSAELEDFKGVKTILKPTLECLVAEGERFSSYFADRQERYIEHRDMPEYYSKIDVLVCTSKIEGTPNPVLEAMACGVPVISTDVGVVPQVFGSLQKDFILSERSQGALHDALLEMRRNPEIFEQLSRENSESIRCWEWSLQAAKFGDYFESLR